MKLQLANTLAGTARLGATLRAAAASTWLLWVLVGFGTAVRVVQYLYKRALWLDEASLALNIVQRDFAGLLQPLDGLQTAPVGFLLLERLMVTLFGPSEYALRLVPLLGGIGALLLFVPVARAVLSRELVPLALFLFAIGDRLIYYANEVKQYSTDVAAGLLITWLGLRYLQRGEVKTLLALAGAGAALVWLAHPALFVLGGVGLVLGLRAFAERRWRLLAGLALIGALWLASFAGSYTASLRLLGDAGQMQSAWQDNYVPTDGGFLPLEIGLWVAQAAMAVPQNPIGYPESVAGIALFFALAGSVALWGERRAQAAMLLAPLGLTLLAAVMQRYPFWGRLLLFLTPALLLLIARGVQLLSRQGRLGAQLATLLLVMMCMRSTLEAGYKLLLPEGNQELPAAMGQLYAQAQPDDLVFVLRDTLPAFDYYTLLDRMPPGTIVRNAAAPFAMPAHIAELDAFAGRPRVWVLVSHSSVRRGVSEAELILYELDKRALRRDAFYAEGAALFLYDFTAEPVFVPLGQR